MDASSEIVAKVEHVPIHTIKKPHTRPAGPPLRGEASSGKLLGILSCMSWGNKGSSSYLSKVGVDTLDLHQYSAVYLQLEGRNTARHLPR